MARRRAVAAVFGLATLAAACLPPSPTAPPSAPPSVPDVATSTPGTPTTRPSSASASSGAEASPGPPAIDMSLLRLLPAEVGGRPIEESPEAALESVNDTELWAHADSIAVGVAVDPTTDTFVVTSVVKLKPGVFDEEFYRDWRDSFDQGVCAQAGGVSGNAEAVIDERTVFIGTCAGGVHTYHVHLEDPDAIVSVNVVGDATFGQELMENLPE